MEPLIAPIFEDVTGRIDGYPGFQIKSMDKDGHTLCEAAKGKRFLGKDESEVEPDTIFWVASCTKIVVAIAVMQCVERGLVSLDTIPSDILPELKDLPLLEGWTEDDIPILGKPKRLPTVREILSHQSGLCVDISEPDMMKWLKVHGKRTNSQSGDFNDLLYPMVFSPGEDWTYSVGMDWMGHLISRLNGNIMLGEYFSQNIFSPLGLKNTTFQPLDDPDFNSRLTGTHWRQKDGTLKLASENHGNSYARSGNHNGGGGLWSTADDLCKLLHGVFLDGNSRILRPESIREIAKPALATSEYMENRVARMTDEQNLNITAQVPPDKPKNFGLGVIINLDELDSGLSPGSIQWSGFPNCYWWVDFEKGLTGAMVSSVLTYADNLGLKANERFIRASYHKMNQKNQT